MSKKDSLIWIIADDRPGNYSQAIGLAEALDRPYEIKKITYDKYAGWPNFLKKFGFIGIDENSKASLLNSSNPPKIVISAGRKTAPISLFIKKNYPGVFNIHIMRPNVNFNKFDLVVLPRHDGIAEDKNIICSIGALSRVDPQLLEDEYQKFKNDIEKISHPRIALLIGGSSKKTKFGKNAGEELVKICTKLANNMKAKFLVTTSRRTDVEVIALLKNALEKNGMFFEWQKNKSNPYFAFLQAADFIITTGDSMGMCSEACSLGKPVYIFNPAEICTLKHLIFHKNLFSEGYARELTSDLRKLDLFSAKILNETNRIGTKINKVLELKNL